MKMNYKKGDLFTSDDQVIAHGCNCCGSMGAGIALQFSNRYPDMYVEYKLMCQREELQPGDAFMYDRDTRVVANLMTQRLPGPDAAYLWIFDSFEKLAEYMEDNELTTLSIPKIGCGIGGLEWDKVESTIVRALRHSNIEVTVYEF